MSKHNTAIAKELNFLANYGYSLKSSKIVNSPKSDYDKGYAAGWLSARKSAGKRIETVAERIIKMLPDPPTEEE